MHLNKDWFAKNAMNCLIFMIVAVILTIGANLFINRRVANDNAIVANQTAQIEGLQNKIAAKKAANNRKVKAAQASSAGINLDRKASDDKKAEALAKKACNWSNGQEYRSHRAYIAKRYKLSNNSSFMRAFMPNLPQSGAKLGKSVGSNMIDKDKLNMQYESFKSYVTSAKNGIYSYFAIVSTVAHNKRGATATGKVAMQYQVLKDGRIVNIKAQTIGPDQNSND